MKKIIQLSILTLCAVGILSVALENASFATSMSKPLKGRGTGEIISAKPGADGVAISAKGSGVASHLGRFEREEQLLLNPQTGQFTGTVVLTAADGEQLSCTLEGGFTSPTTAEGTYTFTGGTGRFENVSGNAYFSVSQSDPVNFSFEFAGAIESK